MTSIGKSALLITSATAIPFFTSQAAAQVAPTEVNEEVVDEFGLERKTGRFVWSSGEIIGIGGEGSRVGISVTGVRNPPAFSQVLPASEIGQVEFNGPRIYVVPLASSMPLFPGAIDPNRSSVTVEYFGGSHSFECDASTCRSHYLGPNKLTPQNSGYLFEDRHGVAIAFEPTSATVDYPDGRQEVFSSAGYRSNNFGFLIRRQGSSGNYAAVNLAVDHCDNDTSSICGVLDGDRQASFTVNANSSMSIIDPAQNTTTIRWETKTAKQYRPPIGSAQPQSTLPYNYDIALRYPVGVTFPGSTGEDITIAYGSHDPLNDIHDDIRVASITKHGVTVQYTHTEHWPFGKYTEVPDHTLNSSELSGVQQGVGEDGSVVFGASRIGRNQVAATPETLCRNVAPPITHPDHTLVAAEIIVCWQTGGSGAGLGGATASIDVGEGPRIAPFPSELEEFEIGSAGAGVVYDLTIEARIDSELVSTSMSTRPHFNTEMARRQLDYVKDGLGRETKYFTNLFDEVAGVTLPEGNGVLNSYDFRGNITSSAQTPKEGSSEPTLTTTLTYPPDCDNVPLARCNKPLSTTDPKGNVTDFTYNDRGQLLTEKGPPPAPGGARPTMVNEYAMRQAYIKDASGNPVAAGPLISMLVKSYSCISSAVCDANTPATDKVVTEYDYGPTTGLNNLLLRGMSVTASNAAGQLETLLTCYTYNYFGEQISETLPEGNANLTSCPA